MDKKFKIIIIICVILIAAVGGYYGYTYYFGEKWKTSENNINEINQNSNINVQENDNTEDNDIFENNSIENSVVEDEVIDTTDQTENENIISSNNDSEIESDNDEEKAIAIVKKDWGTSDGVYFKLQALDSNGNYEISVNDTETTASLAWYTVNPKTGEFSN